jgi:fimbrial chaperone protein
MKYLSSARLSLIAVNPVYAATVSVMPLGFVGSDNQSKNVLTVENQGDTKVRLQIRSYAWDQAAGKDNLQPTRDLIAAPGLLELPPHAKRIVRVIRLKPVSGSTMSYRVVMSELPEPFVPGKGASLKVLMEYNFPFVYEPANAAPVSLHASWKGNTLSVNNSGGRAAKLSMIGPQSSVSWVQGLVGWVLPGATRSFDMTSHAVNISVRVNDVEQTLTAN